MSKKIKILLGVSLALNLLFVGLAGSAIWKFKGFRHHDNRALFFAQKLVKDLPTARQKTLLSGFEDLKTNREKTRELKHTSWKKVMESVGTEPFDSSKLRDALGSMHKVRFDRKQVVGEKFIVLLEQMTPKERAILREGRMFKKMMRFERHRHNR